MAIDHAALAAAVGAAHDDGEAIEPTAFPPELTIEDAYAVQDALVERRREAWGPIAGYKVGFTNASVQSEFGLEAPIYGRVLAGTVDEGGRFGTAGLIEPMIEPEIAFVLDRPLSPPATRLDVAAAARFVVPVIEVVDSRVEGWAFDAAGAVADNALAARLLVGDPVPVGDRDLSLEGVEVRIDGEPRASGTGAAVLGYPAEAVAWLAAALEERGGRLEAGDVVTTGTITDPIPIAAGETALARFASLGTVLAHAK